MHYYHRRITKNNEHAICQQARLSIATIKFTELDLGSSTSLCLQLGTMIFYGTLPTLRDQGAAEKGSGLALADPHTRTKQNV